MIEELLVGMFFGAVALGVGVAVRRSQTGSSINLKGPKKESAGMSGTATPNRTADQSPRKTPPAPNAAPSDFVELTEAQRYEVGRLVKKGNLIEAIKYVRIQKNIGLKEAKDLVDALNDQFWKQGKK